MYIEKKVKGVIKERWDDLATFLSSSLYFNNLIGIQLNTACFLIGLIFFQVQKDFDESIYFSFIFGRN